MNGQTLNLFEVHSAPSTTIDDATLELRIDEAMQRVIHGETWDAKCAASREMRELHKQRSAAQIARMEKARGLR